MSVKCASSSGRKRCYWATLGRTIQESTLIFERTVLKKRCNVEIVYVYQKSMYITLVVRALEKTATFMPT
jgi:hypothetical protein